VKKISRYFSKHVFVNSFVHIVIGAGLGVLLTHGIFDPHPVRFGIIFLVLGVVGYIYAYIGKD